MSNTAAFRAASLKVNKLVRSKKNWYKVRDLPVVRASPIYVLKLTMLHFQLFWQSAESDVLHEINVPTASYRMGMREMALGLAVIDLNQSPESPPLILWYANLWLPSR